LKTSRLSGLPPWVTTVALLLPTYVWMLLAIIVPLGAMFVFSFMDTVPLGDEQANFTLDNYRVFAERPYLIGVAWTSIRLSLWTTGICAVLGLAAAMALVKATKGWFRELFLLLTILPFWTNGLVRIFSWTMVIRQGGVLDDIVHLVLPHAPSVGFLYSFPAMVVGLSHAYLPYMILTCYIALVGIDENLAEAARSLGARAPVIFFKITLPLAAPGLISGAILIFVPVLGCFMEPHILGGRAGVTMGTIIEEQFTQAFNWPLGAALSFTILAVVLGVFATFSGVLRMNAAKSS
jgi:spermidine/putrescine transport system permease protein